MSKPFAVKTPLVPRSGRLGIRLLLICVAATTLGQSVGCNSATRLGIGQSAMLSYRDFVWSQRAFNLRYGDCDREYGQHFENGFRAGYLAIANGEDGYVPALPPVEYRAVEFQSADGAKCVNSWFEGYPVGVAAAKKDNVGTYHDILISRLIDDAVKQEKSPPKLPAAKPPIRVANLADAQHSNHGSSHRRHHQATKTTVSDGSNKKQSHPSTPPKTMPSVLSSTYNPRALTPVTEPPAPTLLTKSTPIGSAVGTAKPPITNREIPITSRANWDSNRK